MTKTMIIAWREFLETVKTKAFVFGAIVMPFIMIIIIMATEKVMRAGAEEKVPLRKIAIVDSTGAGLLETFKDLAAANNKDDPNRPIEFIADARGEAELRQAINNGELYAAILVPAGVLDSAEGAQLARKDNQIEAGQILERMLTKAVVAARYRQHPDLDRALIEKLEQRVWVVGLDTRTGEKVKPRDMSRIMAPFAFMFLLWMGTFGISQGLLTSVIEEKSSRVIEVLLSAVSPLQLMTGKILGLILVGCVLVGIWLTVGTSAARSANVTGMITSDRVLYFLLYFIPAYLFYAALLGAIGSAFNSLKEAQSMVTPITLFGVLPMMFWFPITQYPQGTMAIVLSFLPPVTPFVMMMRICADPETPMWQIVASLVLLWICVFATLWLAGKIFRVGVLMYGKPPTPRELIRWLRYT